MPAGKVGTGSVHFKVDSTTEIDGIVYNVGNGLKVRDAHDFEGISNPQWWSNPQATNAIHGMPAYTVTRGVRPMDWNTADSSVTGAPGQSTILTRDKNSYFELNIMG